jgi:thioredoxin-like negative regulator of GroEL
MDNIFSLDSGVPELKNKHFIRKKNTVKKKTEITLSKKIRGNLRGLILFYTPWCRSCEEFKYKWSEVALLFKNRFFIGAFNVDNQEDSNDILRNELGITTYPTIKFLTKTGKIKMYGGTRNINEIVHFICKKEKLEC